MDYADDLKFWGINESFMEFCCQVSNSQSEWYKENIGRIRNAVPVREKKRIFACRTSSCHDARQLWGRWQKITKLQKKRRSTIQSLHDSWSKPCTHDNHNKSIKVTTRRNTLERERLFPIRKHSGIFLRNLKEELQQRWSYLTSYSAAVGGGWQGQQGVSQAPQGVLEASNTWLASSVYPSFLLDHVSGQCRHRPDISGLHVHQYLPINGGESAYIIVSCPTRQSLLLFIGSLHRFPYPDNKEI